MRTSHCVTLMVILISLTRSCYGLDETCTENGNCSGQGEVCQGSSCVCDTTTHYRATGQPGCSRKAELGVSCPSVLSVRADLSCLDPNAECAIHGSNQPQFDCQCLATFYDNNGEEAGGTCTAKVNLGEDCTQATSGSSSPCNIRFAVCTGSGGSTYRCQCQEGYYQSDTNDCSLELHLGESECTNAAIQCADAHTQCSGGTSGFCQCKDNHYDNNGAIQGGACVPKAELGATCPYVYTVNADQSCIDLNAQCTPTATSQTCQCKATYYDWNGGTVGGSCALKVNLGEDFAQASSDSSSPCITHFAVCTGIGGSTYRCECQTGYYQSDTNSCSLELHLGESECTNAAIQCADAHTQCSGGTSGFCQCTDNHYDNNGDTQGGACDPKVELGYSCPCNEACKTVSASCSGGLCKCNGGFYDTNGDSLTGSCFPR